MKPFNLEEAKAGKPICTRDGRRARIICYDARSEEYPIVALVESADGGEEGCYTFADNGRYYSATECTSQQDNRDLFMAPTAKTVWVNLYRNHTGKVYVGSNTKETEAEAREISSHGTCYVGTYSLTYEE